MRGTSVWNEVSGRYPELKSDDDIADEVLATYSGRRGSERLREEMDRIKGSDRSVADKARALGALERVRRALDRFWHGVADFLGIHYKSADEVADRVMRDLLNGVDPRRLAQKKVQNDIVQRENPMLDDYHTGIRSEDDIHTFAEAVSEAQREKEKYGDEQMSSYPDITDSLLNEAIKTGKITIYSSKPIKDGVFVTPSRMQAQDYAGGRGAKVYSKEVSIESVAWIDVDEGQFAEVKNAPMDKIRFQYIDEMGAESADRGEQGRSLRGDEALTALNRIFDGEVKDELPPTIPTIEKFRQIFSKPIRTFLGELIKVKDNVYNKIQKEKRTRVSGAVMPTIKNADFAMRDTDGSTLYIKRFNNNTSDSTYNIAVVNKHGEVEDYISSVHIKRDANLRNKIKNGAELLLPNKRNGDGTVSRNNSTPDAKLGKISEKSDANGTLFRDEVDGFVSSSVVDGLRERAVELGRELGADVDLVWGDNGGGLAHIIQRHVEEQNDFNSVEEVRDVIDDVIKNGSINEKKSKWDKVVFEKDGYSVVVSRNLRDKDGNIIEQNKDWVVTAFDNSRGRNSKKRESSSDVTQVTPNTNKEGRAVAPNDNSPESKDTKSKTEGQEKSEESKEKEEKPLSEKGGKASEGVNVEPTEAQKPNEGSNKNEDLSASEKGERKEEVKPQEEQKPKKPKNEKGEESKAYGASAKSADEQADFVVSRVKDFDNGRREETGAEEAMKKESGLSFGNGKAKRSVKLRDFIPDRRSEQQQLRGIHYDNGMAVVSDGYRLVAIRTEYPAEYEGRTLMPDGREAKGRFPNWRGVVPNGGIEIGTDWLNRVLGLQLEESDNRLVSFGGKSRATGVMVGELLRLARLAEKISNPRLFYAKDRLLLTGDGVVCLQMLHIGIENEDVSLRDFLNGNVPSLHRAGESNMELTKAEVALRDAVIDRLRENGIDVVTDVSEGQRMLDMANGKERLSGKQKRALETATWQQQDVEANQATVVSSADGAKVLNNLDNLAKKLLEKESNRSKTFMGDVARAIGAKEKGSSSQYATFETKNGTVVTIRLANHNAKVSNFDNAGKDNAISIVITNKNNEGVTNDGKAHIIEFYYNKGKLSHADGKPLAEIVRSIKQALYSGEFKDTTGIAERQEVNGDVVREHRVYHGSGADFEAFDHSHMGEGEGAQAYGWGTYVTEVEGIGRTYAEANSKRPSTHYEYGGDTHGLSEERINEILEVLLDAKPSDGHIVSEYEDALGWYRNRRDEYSQSLVKDASLLNPSDISIVVDKTRNLYSVEIPDDNGKNYLDWNERLSDSQIEAIRAYLSENYRRNKLEDFDASIAEVKGAPNADEVNAWARRGENVYKMLSHLLGSDDAASKALSEMGFTGIKYPAENRSGGRKDGARNYVIFNENDAKIVDKVRFFKTQGGEAYGFTVGGKIYIDPRIASSETAVHEYAHLWAEALRSANAKEWENVVGLMRGTSVWNEVSGRYPELKSDDEIADEVLATYSGRRGSERLREEMDRIKGSERSVADKARALGALERVRRALDRFWHGVADFLGIHYKSADEVADRVMRDLLNGVDPRRFVKGESDGRVREQFIGEDGVSEGRGEQGVGKVALQTANERFNKELDEFKNGTHKGLLHLGKPRGILKQCGITAQEMTISPSVLHKHLKKHNLTTDDLKGLAESIQRPILVYKHGLNNPNMVVVTELNVNGGKLSASFVLDESGKVVEVSNISSVHSKDATKELERLYEMGEIDFKKSLKWVEKEKVLDWLAPSSYENSGMQDNQAPFDIAKIINGFENPKVSEENQIESDKIDREYLQAVKEGDMEKAQRMVNEAAKRAGYSESSDYQGTSAFNGSAPYGNGWYLTKEERKEAWDNDEWDGDSSLGDYIDNGVDGGNIEELTNAYSYRAADPMRKEAIENVRDVVKNKKKTIMMYRSVPSSVKEGHFRNGDWVTPSKKYAIDNARIHGWENDYRIIEQEVPVDDVWFDGNDIAEWGYGRAEDVANEKDFGYKNTKNNRKLLDPVTYDDNGNVIPLSERFNEGSGDIRFRDEVDGVVSSSGVDGMRERAVELGRELGADVDVVSDVSEITDPNPEVQERKRRAKGWYDAKTGRVVINLAAHSDMADVEQTLLHEIVGHRGLRGLVGHENFNGFLDGIYEHASDVVREGIDDIARRKGCSKRVATEEYMSGLAEGGFADRKNAGLWQQIRQWFGDMLSRAKIKLNFSISDNELRYLLWRSHELSRMNGREGVVGRARDLAMQNRLGVGNGVGVLSRSNNSETNVAEINNTFNKELQQQIDGKLPNGHIYRMGKPGRILLSTGVPNLPIQMSAKRLQEKATMFDHDFKLSEVKNLVLELQHPLAVFEYGDKSKAQNIVVSLQQDGKNFIVGLSLNPMVNGNNLEINSIRNVFPKDNSEWLNWIGQGKSLYLDKEKVQNLIDQQRTNLADVDYLDLDSITKVIENFENPKVSDGKRVVDSYDGDLETLFRDADSPVDYERALIRDSYERRLKDVWFQSREALQDGMLSLKETMKDIWRSAGKKFSQITDIPDYANPYLGQNRLSSRNAAEVSDFKRRLFRPLLREVGRLTGFSADGRAKLTDYMMAKHGLERNKVMAERDAKAAYEAEKLKDPNTTKTLADFVAEYRKKDYSGLTSLTGLDDVAAAEAEAKNMVADYEANHDTANLWARTKAVTDAIVQKQYDSGYINSITRNAILNMYDNYIPLRGFEDKTAEDVYSYMKHSNSAFNAPIKTARGRKSKADDPFANMLAMAESGIMRGNRNKLVKLPLLSLVLEHPTDLISVSDVWFALLLAMCKF
ncbi:MAG: hypothetical protein SOT67_03050 [Bacteroidaceae bacterium]|nr:hypothetical protein [Bacteroidaceae bacterium]